MAHVNNLDATVAHYQMVKAAEANGVIGRPPTDAVYDHIEKQMAGTINNLAWRFANTLHERDDCEQMCRIALFYCLPRWTPTRGAFAPFARRVMTRFLVNLVQRQNGLVRKPLRDYLEDECEAVVIALLEDMKQREQPTSSCYGERPDIQAERRIMLGQVMSVLTERERTMYEQRHVHCWTNRQIGKYVGLSDERARVILIDVQRRLNEEAIRRGFTAELMLG